MINVKQPRILIFGAGVIGSAYAIKFAQAGIDVTLLARNRRLEVLRKNGLQYEEKGTVKLIEMKVIENLAPDDIYDYILVPVRYDQIESALSAIKDNQSKNIVTMTNTSVGYHSWRKMVGSRLLPGFPSAGGDIKDGILYAQFGPKFIQATTFGEINGQITKRVKELAQIFETANLPYTISKDITAFQIAHAALVIGMTKAFYTDDGIMDCETARKRETVRSMVVTLKKYMSLLEIKGIPIAPSSIKVFLKFPDWLIIGIFRNLLRIRMVADALLGNHAVEAKKECLLLEKDFLDFLHV